MVRLFIEIQENDRLFEFSSASVDVLIPASEADFSALSTA